jgi:hypothetical protein
LWEVAKTRVNPYKRIGHALWGSRLGMPLPWFNVLGLGSGLLRSIWLLCLIVFSAQSTRGGGAALSPARTILKCSPVGRTCATLPLIGFFSHVPYFNTVCGGSRNVVTVEGKREWGGGVEEEWSLETRLMLCWEGKPSAFVLHAHDTCAGRASLLFQTLSLNQQEELEARMAAEASASEAARRSTEASLRDLTIGVRLKEELIKTLAHSTVEAEQAVAKWVPGCEWLLDSRGTQCSCGVYVGEGGGSSFAVGCWWCVGGGVRVVVSGQRINVATTAHLAVGSKSAGCMGLMNADSS